MIYLDHNSTTRALPEVIEAMAPWLAERWGNPSSVYGFGRSARRAVEDARSAVAMLVGARDEQVIFTASATEATNAALHSAVCGAPSRRHIVTSQVEHSATLSYCEYLERYHGVEVTRVPVSSQGEIDLDQLDSSIRTDTAIVSLIWANNETGVIWPADQLGEICRSKHVPLHLDAVQAVGRIPVDFEKCGAAYISLSGHKLGTPKGIGCLVVSDPCRFVPLIFGGKQERGHRGGTESVPLVAGFGRAAELLIASGLDCWKRVATVRDEFESYLVASVVGVEINGGGSMRLPNTSNVYLPGVDSDALVIYLDQQGICISSGSACMESAIAPSHVVDAMWHSHDRACESARISLGRDSAKEEVQELVRLIKLFCEINL